MQQRLFEIIYLLTIHGSITAGELAERFGVSRRTIYRDVDALSGAGIPVYAEKGRGGGIRMLPEYVLEKTHFTRDEQEQLVMQFQSLAALQMPDSQQLGDKLSAIFGKRDSWLEIDFAPWAGGDEARELFRLLREAILSQQAIRFLYTGMGGEQLPREVEPLKILFRGQGWYLYAFCRRRQDYRVFKLSRIREAENTGDSFTREAPKSPLSSMPYQHPGGKMELSLRFSAKAAFRVYDEFPHSIIQPQNDGGYLVTCTMPQGSWLHSYLLSFGDTVEVLEPPSLRAEFHTMLRNACSLYEK